MVCGEILIVKYLSISFRNDLKITPFVKSQNNHTVLLNFLKFQKITLRSARKPGISRNLCRQDNDTDNTIFRYCQSSYPFLISSFSVIFSSTSSFDSATFSLPRHIPIMLVSYTLTHIFWLWIIIHKYLIIMSSQGRLI